MIGQLIKNYSQILDAIGFIAIGVTVITQVLKDLPGIRKIPTDILVVILSLIGCVGLVLGYLSYLGEPVLWQYVVGAIILGFGVAFVCMYGWSKAKALFDRFKFNK